MEFYSTICRLCESPGQAGSTWIELYTNNEDLPQKIRACANVMIDEHDQLPQRICNRCHQAVEQAYSFRLQCEITDAKLRHEVAFIRQSDCVGKAEVAPFDYGHFLEARDQPKTDVVAALGADKVYVKTEPEEGQPEEEVELDVPLIDAFNVETELREDSESEKEAEADAGKKDAGKDEAKSGGSESEDDSDWFDKAISGPPREKKKRNRSSNMCDICGEKFVRKYDLYTHKKAAHGKTQYQCKECNKCFSRRSRLEDHEILHTGIRQFECPECDKKYATQSGLRTHIEDVHTENLPFVCDKCGKGFSKEGKLRYHYAVHIETRDFICDICEKGFKTPAHLNLHKSTHLPQDKKRKRKARDRRKTCVCPFCGKISTTINTHTMHLRTHTGEQRYECHICFKRFTSSGSHKKHLRVHSGEKPYVCQYCQKPFRQKHHMDTHIRGVHTNEKPYQCKYCPRAFATLGNMRLHEKSHGEPASIVKPGQEGGFPDGSSIHSPASQSSSVMMISSNTQSPMMNPGIMIPPTTSGFNLYFTNATQ